MTWSRYEAERNIENPPAKINYPHIARFLFTAHIAIMPLKIFCLDLLQSYPHSEWRFPHFVQNHPYPLFVVLLPIASNIAYICIEPIRLFESGSVNYGHSGRAKEKFSDIRKEIS